MEQFFLCTDTQLESYLEHRGSEILDFKDKDLWFKLKHRIIPTKDKLKNYGITQENNCPLCKDNIETIKHLFIYCIQHIDVCLFVEQLIRKYTKNNTFNNTFCLNDVSRILGEGIQNQLCILLIVRLHRSIWKLRCKTVYTGSNNNNNNNNMSGSYKAGLRNFLFLEKRRLPDNVFKSMYCRNNILCYI